MSPASIIHHRSFVMHRPSIKHVLSEIVKRINIKFCQNAAISPDYFFSFSRFWIFDMGLDGSEIQNATPPIVMSLFQPDFL